MDLNRIYEQSYVPYSRRPEAAVAYSREGRFFPGKRIENISYSLSVSAAQNALFCCLSEGDTPEKLMVTNTGDRLLSFWEKEYGVALDPLEAGNLPDISFASVVIEQESVPADILTPLLDYALVAESNFPVAALIETETGFYSGVNIECSSWEMGLCAERVAIIKALTYNQSKLKSLHIHSRDGEFNSPCGVCRQVISEHLSRCQIHLHHADHSRSHHFSDDLLPFSFHSPSLSQS